MMKCTLNTTVSALALLLALNTLVSASYSDEEDSPEGRYSVGKEDEWDRQSMASRAFSDRRGPAPKKPSKEEELSYNPEDEWERASEYSSATRNQPKEQKLTDIKALKEYFFKGNLEITPENYQVLTKHADFYETAFKTFDKGVVIKGWKSSLGFKPLKELLHSFSDIKIFKVGMKWDSEADIAEPIARTIQFYENLTELDISNCKLTDEAMIDIMESVRDPLKLSLLDVRGNKLSKDTLANIKKHFPNLASFKSNISLETETNVKATNVMPLHTQKSSVESAHALPSQPTLLNKPTQDNVLRGLNEAKARSLSIEEFATLVKSDPTLNELKLNKNINFEEVKALSQNPETKPKESVANPQAKESEVKPQPTIVKETPVAMTEIKVEKFAEQKTPSFKLLSPLVSVGEQKPLMKNELSQAIDPNNNNKAPTLLRPFKKLTRETILEALNKVKAKTLSIEEFAAFLKSDHTLQNLDLSNNFLGNILNLVGIRYNIIGNEGIKVLAPCLKYLTSLTTLDLYGNQIGDGGAQALAPFLKDLASLTTLYLWLNNIGDKGVIGLAPFLKDLASLTTLYLQHNKIGDEGAQALALSLRGTSLTRLFLTDNKIGDEGAISLAHTVSYKENFSWLGLEENKISDEGKRKIEQHNYNIYNKSTFQIDY